MNEQAYTVTLPDWEGPLDLLLHVIKAHELDILDIPISFVTEQYLAHIETMRDLNLDVAAEYLEMAATLALIKSRMMLPQAAADDEELPEDEADPREELVRRLLQYQRYRDAAEKLASRPFLGRDTFGPAPVEDEAPAEDGGLAELGIFDLLEAFRGVLERTKVDLSHEITAERVSVSARIAELVEILRPGELVPFERLLEGQVTRIDLVVTFLAILEMTKLRMTRLFQAPGGGQIYVTLAGAGARSRLSDDGDEKTFEAETWRRTTSRSGRSPRSRTLTLLRMPTIQRRGRAPQPPSRTARLLRTRQVRIGR